MDLQFSDSADEIQVHPHLIYAEIFYWYYVVFALLGVAIGAMIVSGMLVIMEFSEPQRRPTYAGMANSSMGLVSLAAPLIGAWLAKMSYSWLFALSAFVYLLAFIALHWWVKEPRWA